MYFPSKKSTVYTILLYIINQQWVAIFFPHWYIYFLSKAKGASAASWIIKMVHFPGKIQYRNTNSSNNRSILYTVYVYKYTIYRISIVNLNSFFWQTDKSGLKGTIITILCLLVPMYRMRIRMERNRRGGEASV